MLDEVTVSQLGDYVDVDEWMSEHYAGEGDTLADWCEEYCDDTGMFEGLKNDSLLRTYFNFESFARDMRLGGDISEERVGGKVMGFWNR